MLFPGSVSRSLLIVFFVTVLSLGVKAESVSVEQWRGHNVVRLSAEVSTGLASKLEAAISKADVWANGARVLLLDSPGGNVAEALKISTLLRRYKIHTVVPNSSVCASACASIIFVSGHYRTLEPFGALGQHTCSINGKPDQECNEIITENARLSGISAGAIAAFISYTPPTDMIWFSREDVDGWGLSYYPGEDTSNFERSEPRVIRMFTGRMPPAQSDWRLDFHGDGFRAFVRTVSDAEREMQLNLFCYEGIPGRLFLSMDVTGDVEVLNEVIGRVTVATDEFSWDTVNPITFQQDPEAASVVMEIPNGLIRDFITKSNRLAFNIELRDPYVPMLATTFLSESRRNLLFAANNCSRNEYGLDGKPVQ